MKTVVIDPVTRIEGHAKITIHLDDDGHVADTTFHVTQLRGFEKFVEGRPAANASPIEQLSNRELEVFQLLGLGHNTRQIADHLHVGFKTVQAYCARIKEKLKLANATELLREAIRWQESQQAK